MIPVRKTRPASVKSVKTAVEMIKASKEISVLTGAGISTASNIPDYRGPQGVWTKDPEAEAKATYQYWVTHAEHRQKRWAEMVNSKIWSAVEPNAGHISLNALQKTGQLHTLVTQNIDGLHQLAGVDMGRLVEVHGSTRRVVCVECSDENPMEYAIQRVRQGEADPKCESCCGILKAAVISFGQALIEEDLYRAQLAAQECDLLICIGTSLGVFPIANMVPIAVAHEAKVLIINGEPTAMDHRADHILRGDINDILPKVMSEISS